MFVELRVVRSNDKDLPPVEIPQLDDWLLHVPCNNISVVKLEVLVARSKRIKGVCSNKFSAFI